MTIGSLKANETAEDGRNVLFAIWFGDKDPRNVVEELHDKAQVRWGGVWHGVLGICGWCRALHGFGGVVWYGMVWYGMVWYGMVWYGMVWYGMVWYGMVWYGMVWYGMVWYGMVWYGMVWYGLVWYDERPPVCGCVVAGWRGSWWWWPLSTGWAGPLVPLVEFCVVWGSGVGSSWPWWSGGGVRCCAVCVVVWCVWGSVGRCAVTAHVVALHPIRHHGLSRLRIARSSALPSPY